MDDLGLRIRGARQRRGVGVRAFAREIGVSPGLISQIELGRAQPSMGTLLSIVQALEISVGEVLGAAAGASPLQFVLQRQADIPVLELENGVRWDRYAAGDHDPAHAVLVTYAPGGFSSPSGEPTEHAGVEFVIMLEGALRVEVAGSEPVDLVAGDSIRLDAELPHVYRNVTAAPARGIWFVVAPPT